MSQKLPLLFLYRTKMNRTTVQKEGKKKERKKETESEKSKITLTFEGHSCCLVRLPLAFKCLYVLWSLGKEGLTQEEPSFSLSCYAKNLLWSVYSSWVLISVVDYCNDSAEITYWRSNFYPDLGTQVNQRLLWANSWMQMTHSNCNLDGYGNFLKS